MVKTLCVVLAALSFCACGHDQVGPDGEIPSSQVEIVEQESTDQDVQSSEMETSEAVEDDKERASLKITVGEYDFQATFEQNSSAEEFQELLEKGPVTIEMEDYGGFEKVGPLGTELTRNDEQITTEPGDVILYQGNQITIYYGTNSWNFTRLAKIDDVTDLKEKLGTGTVRVTFSLE